MPILPTGIIPKNILAALRGASNHAQFSSLLLEVAQGDSEEAFRDPRCGSGELHGKG